MDASLSPATIQTFTAQLDRFRNARIAGPSQFQAAGPEVRRQFWQLVSILPLNECVRLATIINTAVSDRRMAKTPELPRLQIWQQWLRHLVRERAKVAGVKIPPGFDVAQAEIPAIKVMAYFEAIGISLLNWSMRFQTPLGNSEISSADIFKKIGCFDDSHRVRRSSKLPPETLEALAKFADLTSGHIVELILSREPAPRPDRGTRLTLSRISLVYGEHRSGFVWDFPNFDWINAALFLLNSKHPECKVYDNRLLAVLTGGYATLGISSIAGLQEVSLESAVPFDQQPKLDSSASNHPPTPESKT